MENALSFEIEPDEVEIFVHDVNEYLHVMEAGVVRLEQSADAETLNAVFRAAHTLKALAATIGHRQMADLTHTLETLFGQVRASGEPVNAAVVDVLLEAIDILGVQRDEVVSRQPGEVDAAAMQAQLVALAEGSDTGETAANAVSPPAPHHLTSKQASRAQARRDAGDALLEIVVVANTGVFAPAARLFQAVLALVDVGEIVAQEPSQEQLTGNQHDGRLWLLLATQRDQEAVARHLSDIPDLAECRIQPYTGSLNANARPSPAEVTVAGLGGTVRISVEHLDTLMNLVGELVTDRTHLVQLQDSLRVRHSKDPAVSSLGTMAAHFSRVVDQLQQEVMQARMLPIAHLFDKFPRVARDLARSEGKQVNLVIEGAATELDRSVIEAIGDPLIHLLRNAISHGIEQPHERHAANKPQEGTVRLTAAHEEGHIVITMQDDGRGIDPAKIRQAAVEREVISQEKASQLDDNAAISLIFQPNLSTAGQVTEVAGRGVGLDVVLTNVKRLNGSVMVESEVGRGTTFRLVLPLTLAIMQAMLVGVGNDVYAVPMTGIVEVLYHSDISVSSVKGRPVTKWRDQVLPLVSVRKLFNHAGLAASPNGREQAIVIVSWGKLTAGLLVDRLIGKQEIVIKSLSPIIGNVAGVSGCAVLGDGSVVLIVDVPGLIGAAMHTAKEK